MADEQEPGEEMEEEVEEEEQGSEDEQPDQQGQAEALIAKERQHLQHVVACLERSVIRLSKKFWLMPRFDAATASCSGESSSSSVGTFQCMLIDLMSSR
jgi:hypothetical protein